MGDTDEEAGVFVQDAGQRGVDRRGARFDDDVGRGRRIDDDEDGGRRSVPAGKRRPVARRERVAGLRAEEISRGEIARPIPADRRLVVGFGVNEITPRGNVIYPIAAVIDPLVRALRQVGPEHDAVGRIDGGDVGPEDVGAVERHETRDRARLRREGSFRVEDVDGGAVVVADQAIVIGPVDQDVPLRVVVPVGAGPREHRRGQNARVRQPEKVTGFVRGHRGEGKNLGRTHLSQRRVADAGVKDDVGVDDFLVGPDERHERDGERAADDVHIRHRRLERHQVSAVVAGVLSRCVRPDRERNVGLGGPLGEGGVDRSARVAARRHHGHAAGDVLIKLIGHVRDLPFEQSPAPPLEFVSGGASRGRAQAGRQERGQPDQPSGAGGVHRSPPSGAGAASARTRALKASRSSDSTPS